MYCVKSVVCINSAVVSRFTLSLFEDSGWYRVDYEAGLTEVERLWGYSKCIAVTDTFNIFYGLDEGCDFVTANCNTTSYPPACEPCCDDLTVKCSYNYQSAVSGQLTVFIAKLSGLWFYSLGDGETFSYLWPISCFA